MTDNYNNPDAEADREDHMRRLGFGPDVDDELVAKVMPDSAHYRVGGIESIDVIRAKLTPEQFHGFCLGNAMKYVHRCGHKDDAAADARKAIDYLAWFADSAGGDAKPVEVDKSEPPDGWSVSRDERSAIEEWDVYEGVHWRSSQDTRADAVQRAWDLVHNREKEDTK